MKNLHQVTFIESYFEHAHEERQKAKINYVYHTLTPENMREKYPSLHRIFEVTRVNMANSAFYIDPFLSPVGFLERVTHPEEFARDVEMIDSEISLEKLFEPIQ